MECRDADITDLAALVSLENRAFSSDKLSKRQFQYWLKASNKVFLVAVSPDKRIVGYGLVIMRKGTRLARLYSIAIDPQCHGIGLGCRLLQELEQRTLAFEKLFMRLEVSKTNDAAIRLYKRMGYRVFGHYPHYYEDESDALRMQKAIHNNGGGRVFQPYPWYQQTTEFTCGPSALMMAMAKLQPEMTFSQELELDVWREATTIFMTSGHGGCHPIGLALAAQKRGYKTAVYMNQSPPLFTNSVRSERKKQILTLVEQQFVHQAELKEVKLHFDEINLEIIEKAISQGATIISLISTYQFDGNKVPHWVTITAVDKHYLYLHDPDLDTEKDLPVDCQHIPIAREDFTRLSSYGKARLRTAVFLYN